MAIKITRGVKARAQKIVIYGIEGVGKTTLASEFPSPLILDCERGSDHVDVDRIEINCMDDFREACLFLIREPHNFKSAIVDTGDWLATRANEEMLKADGCESIEDYGYGKGYKKAEERFMKILGLLDRVQKKGIHVVLLAHSRIVKFEEPDKGGSYDRYELKLEKKIMPLVKEWCDCLLFLNYETFMTERVKGQADGKLRATGGKERVIHCNHAAAWDAKNRHGLPDKVKATIEALDPIIGGTIKSEEPAPVQPKPTLAERDADINDGKTSPDEASEADDVETPTGIHDGKERAEEVSKIDGLFNGVVEDAGGLDAVAAFLKTKGKSIAEIDENYKNRVIENCESFVKQVKALKEGGAK